MVIMSELDFFIAIFLGGFIVGLIGLMAGYILGVKGEQSKWEQRETWSANTRSKRPERNRENFERAGQRR